MLNRRVPVPGWLRNLYRSSLVIVAIGIGGTLALEAWGRNLWSLPTWEIGTPFVLAMLYLFASIFIGAGYTLVAAARKRP